MSIADKTTVFVAFVSLLSALLGGLLAICGNVVIQYMSHKSDKNKILSQKLEEIYDLSLEVKRLLNLELINKSMIPIGSPTELIIPLEKSVFFEITNKFDAMIKISTLYYAKDLLKEVFVFRESIFNIMSLTGKIDRIDSLNFDRYIKDPTFTDFVKHISSQIGEAHTKLCIALGKARAENPVEVI